MERQQQAYYEQQTREAVEQMVTELGDSCGVPVQKVEVTMDRIPVCGTGEGMDVGDRRADAAGDAQADSKSLWDRGASGGGVWRLMDMKVFCGRKSGNI